MLLNSSSSLLYLLIFFQQSFPSQQQQCCRELLILGCSALKPKFLTSTKVSCHGADLDLRFYSIPQDLLKTLWVWHLRMMDILKDFCQHSSDNIKREIKNQPKIQLHRKKKKKPKPKTKKQANLRSCSQGKASRFKVNEVGKVGNTIYFILPWHLQGAQGGWTRLLLLTQTSKSERNHSGQLFWRVW